jgi:hypothetical protein
MAVTYLQFLIAAHTMDGRNLMRPEGVAVAAPSCFRSVTRERRVQVAKRSEEFDIITHVSEINRNVEMTFQCICLERTTIVINDYTSFKSTKFSTQKWIAVISILFEISYSNMHHDSVHLFLPTEAPSSFCRVQ